MAKKIEKKPKMKTRKLLALAKWKVERRITLRKVELEVLRKYQHADEVSHDKTFYRVGSQIVINGAVHTFFTDVHAARDFKRLNKKRKRKLA